MEEEIKKELIALSDFQKIDLRVGDVVGAEELPHSEKLLKLRVKIGESERHILAGIKKNYSPDELVGKKVIVLYNLEPKKLAGEISEGMLLAASNDTEGPFLLTPEHSIESGSSVR